MYWSIYIKNSAEIKYSTNNGFDHWLHVFQLVQNTGGDARF